MKKLILSLTIGLVGMTTYGQQAKKDTTFLTIASDTVGFVNHYYYVENINNPNGNGKIRVSDVTITKPLNKNESSILENRYGGFGVINYDFKLPSDYLKQSADYHDRAIKTRLTTSLIGVGLAVIGGIVAGTPSYSTTTTMTTTQSLLGFDVTGSPVYSTTQTPITTTTPNNDNLNMGLVIGGLGIGVGAVGLGISINLDFQGNEMLRKGAIKFSLKGL